MAQLEAVSEWVSITGAKLGCRDSDDDKLLETALMGEADCLVTGDRDLLEMSPFNDTSVRRIKAVPICGVLDAALFRGIEVSVDAVSDARGGCLDGVAGEMGVSGGRLDLRVSQQFSYHGQALAERQRTGSKRMAEVVNSHPVESGAGSDITRGSERKPKPVYEMVGIVPPQPNKTPLTQQVSGVLIRCLFAKIPDWQTIGEHFESNSSARLTPFLGPSRRGHCIRVIVRSGRGMGPVKRISHVEAKPHKGAKTSRNRIETLEVQLERLRATGAVLSRALYGRKSEQQDKPGSERKRGQQRGAPGHGRTQRPGLDERTEEHNPPPDACVCGRCGQPYAPNGAEESTLVEIEVKAHKRVIRRPRWRRTCECASSPMEVSAPPVPRLFPRTLYGTSFWARFLFEHCACFRPVHRVAAWMSAQGLTVSPGTLADSLKRFVPLFEPLAEAILAHQNKAALRHADETTWRVQELRGEDRSSRAWLWVSVSNDAVSFHIDPSRSAEAAQKLFAESLLDTVIVCDRYSAYKRLARLRAGQGDPCILLVPYACWSHMRRDFVECAAGQVRLTDWCQGWIERIASIYRLNEARLAHYDPVIERQTPAFDAAQGALNEALDGLFAEAARELVGLPDPARQGRALRSLLNHREGLSVFVDRPQVPLDNNRAERFLRGPAIGRRLSFGSDSEDGARFTAIMYSVVGTLSMNGIDILSWLDAWLAACAENDRKPPDDLSPWLPWSMSEERRRELMAPA